MIFRGVQKIWLTLTKSSTIFKSPTHLIKNQTSPFNINRFTIIFELVQNRFIQGQVLNSEKPIFQITMKPDSKIKNAFHKSLIFLIF